MTPEEELTLALCGRAAYREAESESIVKLAERSDLRAFTDVLTRQRLLPLVGSRLVELAPMTTSGEFAESVSSATRQNQYLAILHEAVTLAMLRALAEAGISAIPLKGALLGEAIYGDPGLRFAMDIDLLVHPDDLNAAVDVMRSQGYGRSHDLPWEDGLPLLHHALPPERPNLPQLELHWRIHWNESRFSQAMLARSSETDGRGRVPQPADELAALLLFYARDSFFGLKLAADIGAWWDARGHELAPVALDPIVAAHPELRGSIGAALLVAERLVGLPAGRLLSAQWEPNRRARAAASLANWTATGEPAKQVANMMAVDWLLTPRGRRRSFARRYMFQPSPVLAATYGRSPDRRVRNELWRIVHGTSRAAKFGYRYCGIRYSIRGGRKWSVPA